MSKENPDKSAARRRMPTGVIARTRYVVGIDLGTTNTALAYVDRRSGKLARAVRSFDTPQLTEPGLTEARPTLPSVAYVRGAHELSAEQVVLPWGDTHTNVVVGELARRRGTLTPDRMITSAKSWLCHPGVDRKAAILPWGAPEEVQRRSPVEVEALYLRHLAAAWDHQVAGDDETKRLRAQDVVVTIPASFDEVARELTVQAVRQAGLEEALLIEEPQAALYAWIAAHEDEWQELLTSGEVILVCDVGGGTTDFSLIEVTSGDGDDGVGSAGQPGFERTAVGDHLLLGGDNMDLALARRVEERLGRSLDLRSWQALVQACREAKVRLLEGQKDEVKLTIARTGSKLIGGTITARLTVDEVRAAIVEGFFPLVPPDEAPSTRRRSGLKELGLPYESEPAVTRHLRDFLRRHAPEGRGLARVDRVLFNGGVFRTRALRERVLEVLRSWQTDAPLEELEGSDLDLAVARGAAYYGLVRRGKGTRIRSGAGRAYYLEVGTRSARGRSALCLIPRGLEEGAVVTIGERELALKANRPVVFPFHTSTARDDPAGAVVGLDGERDADDFEELAPLHTVIRVGRKRGSKVRDVPVELVARYTEIGTLEMWCQAKDGEHRWRLELDTRPRAEEPAPEPGAKPQTSASARLALVDPDLPPVHAAGAAGAADAGDAGEGEGAPVVDPGKIEAAKAALKETFALPAGSAQRPLEQLGKRLEELLDGAREGWPVPVIRALFDALLEVKDARKRSPFHEARWLNLAGFCLRPGFGATLDEFRVSDLWKVHLEGPLHPSKDAVRLEWVVAFRRIAGGLNRGQQETLFSPIQPVLFGTKGSGGSKQEVAEYWRLAASLEHLAPKKRRRLGDELLDQLEKGKGPPRWGPWAVGRLGGRLPLYGPLDRLVSADVATNWLRRLLKLAAKEQGGGGDVIFATIQMARLTGDRSRDVPDELRAQAIEFLQARGVGARALRPLREVVQAEVRTQQEFYGDSVPIGLVLKD